MKSTCIRIACFFALSLFASSAFAEAEAETSAPLQEWDVPVPALEERLLEDLAHEIDDMNTVMMQELERRIEKRNLSEVGAKKG